MTVANSNLDRRLQVVPAVGHRVGHHPDDHPSCSRTRSGCQVWTGDCADADPASTPAAAGVQSWPATRGDHHRQRRLDAVDVTVRRTSATGTLVSGATISAIHAAGTGCLPARRSPPRPRPTRSGQLRLAPAVAAPGSIRAGHRPDPHRHAAPSPSDPVTTTVPVAEPWWSP